MTEETLRKTKTNGAKQKEEVPQKKSPKKQKAKTTSKTNGKEKHTFQAETKELLNLMVNSLYTHKEIFCGN